MTAKGTLCIVITALVLAGPVSAGGEEASPTEGPALFRLPLGTQPTNLESLERLGPERELELRALPGELVLARLGLGPAGLTPRLSAAFEGEGADWFARASFVPGGPVLGGDMSTRWLAMPIPADAEPGVYEGDLIVRAGKEELRAPLIVTVSSGRLGPSTTRSLVLSSTSTPEPQGLPPSWPLELPVTFTGLEQLNGDVGLDMSALEALVGGLPRDLVPGQPLPVFLAPLMDRLCEQFGVQRLSPTYVLALHSILTQLRDWAKDKGVSLLFVPPTAPAEDDPDGLALQQHVLILRETPGIRLLLPAEPLLELKRPQQQRLLGLAQAYLIEGPKGLALVRRHGVEGTPLWLRVPASRRLQAGFWARSVGAGVVMLEGTNGPNASFQASAAETDARYFDTAAQGLAAVRKSGEPTTQRLADETQDLLDKLSRDVGKVVAEGRSDVDPQAEAAGWRQTLRRQIEQLDRALE